MPDTNDIKELLVELRDLQREHLAEYRNVTQRSLELQQKAVARQEQVVKLYRRMVVAGAVVITAIVGLIVYLIWRYL
jgi:cytochrome c-type biogenesis protein CcmH/NrfG